jgi:glucokinase
MHYIGIDIGGTTIKAGRVDTTGTVMEFDRASTPANSLEDLLQTITDLVTRLQEKASITAVGIGVPGLRNARTGIMKTSPHIPGLRDVNLEDLLRDRLNLPVITENDANAGAYGEWASGAGKGVQHMAYITLGTGLGCGLILSGSMFRGISGYAGELGHTVVEPEGRQCACGSVGCLETRVSATGIVQSARDANFAGRNFTAEDVYNAAIEGDKIAIAVFREAGRYLGIACTNLINLLNLQAIVVGGGVMAAGDWFLNVAREEVTRRAFASSARDCAIVQSQLWPDAGLIGAAMLARDSS